MALTKSQQYLLKAAQETAMELGERGKELTSLIGELWTCDKGDLVWEPSEGYDAKKGDLTFQIKTRKSWSTQEVNPRGRLGRYGTKKGYLFDVAIYTELDGDFNPVNIWHMNAGKVESLEEQISSNAGLHVYTFKKSAERLEI